ncbi:hypothetical protein RRG08_067264, partial [Elysia crispata]
SGACNAGCEPGYTGLKCDEKCLKSQYGEGCAQPCSDHCAGDRPLCHHVTGTCDLGCDPGYQGDLCTHECTKGNFGKDCSKTCSGHCAGDRHLCHHVTGTCDLGCDPGYQGDLCTNACPRGQYGRGCVEKCSDHCTGPAGECDFRTGQCYQGCEPGFQPPTCHKECPTGTYGSDCGKTCSVHCANSDHVCNKTDGSCDQGCKPGYKGRFCSETCPMGKYGSNCNTTCSDQCVGKHNPCHHIDGSCYLGCVQDDQSPMCRGTRVNQLFDEGTGQKSSSISPILFIVVFIVITAVAAVIVGLLVWRLRITTKHSLHRSPPEDFTDRVELVQVENPSLAPQLGTLARGGSNHHYEPVELSPLRCCPNDNDPDQYATPLDMERELGEYEMPLASNVKKNDTDDSRKPHKSSNGKSSQEIQDNEKVSGLYCNSDHLPAGHQCRGIKETERKPVTANSSDVHLRDTST